MTDIQARVEFSKGGIFNFRKKGTLSIRTQNDIDKINRFNENHLEFEASSQVTYKLDFAEVIHFDRRVISGSGTYIPENRTIELTKDSLQVYLFKERFFDAFDVRLYTDLTGIEENNPNGLLQVQAGFTFITNTKTFPSPWLTVFNTVTPFVTFSKIEKKVDVLVLDNSFVNVNTPPYSSANAFDLFRFSRFNTGIDLNVLSFIGRTMRLRINLKAGIFRTKVDSLISEVNITPASSTSKQTTADTSFTYENQKVVTSWFLLPTINYQVIDGKFIDGDFVYGLMFYELIDDGIRIKSNDTRFISDDIFFAKDGSGKIKFNSLHKFQLNLNIHPNPEDKDKSIFLRTTYYVNKPDNNFTFQVGYATPITRLFSSARTLQQSIE